MLHLIAVAENGLNSDCVTSEQCTAVVANSICEDKLCVCSNGHVEQEGSCLSAKRMYIYYWYYMKMENYKYIYVISV